MTKEKGQSLVEIAIMAPLLIFILIGLFEVGWAIRSYMVLSVASREAARFSTKICTLDWMGEDPEQIQYSKVFTQMLASAGKNLPDADWNENGYFVISLYEVPPVWPCDPELREEPMDGDYWPNCNCDEAVRNHYTTETVLGPVTDPRMIYTVPLSRTDLSQVDPLGTAQRYLDENIRFTCFKMKEQKDAVPERHRIAVVEVGFDHYQLVSFPLLSIVNPIPMRIKTVMRYNESRDYKEADLPFLCGW